MSTNAVIERSFPPIALLVTEGFRDILGIARLRVDRPVDLFARRAPPLIPRRMVFEVPERLLSDGSVDRPLDPAAATAAARRRRPSGATGLAICLLHAHRNPAHERAAADAIRAALPDMDVVLSHEVWPQSRRIRARDSRRAQRLFAPHRCRATSPNSRRLHGAGACRAPAFSSPNPTAA